MRINIYKVPERSVPEATNIQKILSANANKEKQLKINGIFF